MYNKLCRSNYIHYQLHDKLAYELADVGIVFGAAKFRKNLVAWSNVLRRHRSESTPPPPPSSSPPPSSPPSHSSPRLPSLWWKILTSKVARKLRDNLYSLNSRRSAPSEWVWVQNEYQWCVGQILPTTYTLLSAITWCNTCIYHHMGVKYVFIQTKFSDVHINTSGELYLCQ